MRDRHGRFTAQHRFGRIGLVTSRTWAVALLVLSPCAAALAFFVDLWSLQTSVCEQASSQEVCIALGFVQRASAEEETAWNKAQNTGSCDDYRSYLRTTSEGVRADRAFRILAAKKIIKQEAWRDEERLLPLYVTYTQDIAGRALGANAIAADAERLCTPYRSGSFQIRSVTTRIATQTCGVGRRCLAEGLAVCLIRARYETSREVCLGK